MENIGWASLEIVPSLRGFEGKVNASTSGALTRSGTSGGEKFGSGFASKASHTMHEKFKETAKFVIGPLVGAFALEKGVEFAKEAISGAEDLAKSQNRLNLIFGHSADAVDKFGEHSAKTYGLSDLAARKSAASIGLLGRQAGLSNEANAKFSVHFSKLASDLASFNNVDPAVTLKALTSGLAGATRGLKPFGILIDSAQQKAEALRLGLLKPVKDSAKIHAAQVAVLNDQKAYNDAVGKSGKGSLDALTAQAKLGTAQNTLKTAVAGTLPALTAQQKVLANASLIQQQASKAQGDFGRSSHDLSNQQKILSASISDAKDKIGKGLLPIATDLVGYIDKKALPVIDDFATWFEKRGPSAIAGFTDDVKPLAHSLLPAVGTGFKDIGGFLKTAAPYAEKTINAFNSLPDWAQKSLVLGTGAAVLAKKTGALSVGKSALTGGGGIVSSFKPVPVFVTNEGFGGAGAGAGGATAEGSAISKLFGKLAPGAAGAGLTAGTAAAAATAGIAAGVGIAKVYADHHFNVLLNGPMGLNTLTHSFSGHNLIPQGAGPTGYFSRYDPFSKSTLSTGATKSFLSFDLAATGTKLDALRANLGKTSTSIDIVRRATDKQDASFQVLARHLHIAPREITQGYRLDGLLKARLEFDALQAHMGRHQSFTQNIELAGRGPAASALDGVRRP